MIFDHHIAADREWTRPAAVLLLVAGLLALAATAVTGADVDEVVIEGNRFFSDGRIKDLMKTRGSGWFTSRPFIRRNVEIDLASIEALYHKHGFLDCVLDWEQRPSKEEHQIIIAVIVREGSRTFVRQLSFSGNQRLSDAFLARALETAAGQPLNVTSLRTDVGTISDLYGNAGYPYARAAADVQRDSTAARITFQISEGPPVHIHRVEVRGLQEVKTSVVRREMTIGSGDLYDREAILDSRGRIYSTGLFSYVDLRLTSEPSDSTRPDLSIFVQERPLRWVGVSTEVGQDAEYDLTTDLSAEWGNKNLFSTGRKLSLKATATFRVLTEWENLKNRLELTYTEPWFLGLRMPAWVNLYFQPGSRSKGRSYRVQRFGGEFNLSRELGRSSRIWSTVRYEKVDIFGIDPEVAEQLRELSGERIRRYVSLSWERDTRDDIFEPAEGSLTQASAQFVGGPLGGDDHYIKTQASWHRYQRVFPPAVLASRIKLGLAEKHGSGEEVPPDDRFFAGGANTVRGLTERSLGPKDSAGNPLGGKALFLFNAELRRKIWGRLGVSLFYDLGGVWDDPARARLDQMWSTTGMEMWFSTPVGPVRVAHGIPLQEDFQPAKGRWHLAILYAF
jgi:outer membrane protein insertion porin family